VRRYGYKFIALVLFLLVVLWYAWQGGANRIVIVNQSGQAITEMTITIGEQVIPFMHVPQGAEVSATFNAKANDRFVLKGQFGPGTLVTGTFPYVPKSYFGDEVRFVIRPDGHIIFEHK
jgi:hypothetical protein